ncbi:MAG: hypothetical protein ACRCZF_07990 [Gemmataceae bacterium]
MRGLRFLTAILGLLLGNTTGWACPFCNVQGQTLSGEVNQADLIVLGTLKNPKRDPNDVTRGSTELHIETIVKPHDYLAGRKMLLLPRYVPLDAEDNKFLVFCAVYPGTQEVLLSTVVSSLAQANVTQYQLDAYRGEPIKAGSKLAEYLKGALAVREKDNLTKLKYFFDYLDSPELTISSDAFMEFGNSDYKDVRALAEKLPPGRVMKWLADPQTAASRFGFYGMLVGHGGKAEDATALRKMLDEPTKIYSSGLDGMLSGYIMLDKVAGWDYLLGILRDDKKDFAVRYAGLKVLRFFWEYRPDVIPQAEILKAMQIMVLQSDIADLPMEDLRKWEQWTCAEAILAAGKLESHSSIPIVRRAVLRFLLSVPKPDVAMTAYVDSARKADPDRVKSIEEMLRDEKKSPMK